MNVLGKYNDVCLKSFTKRLLFSACCQSGSYTLYPPPLSLLCLLCTISVSFSGVRLSSLSTAHHCKRSHTNNTLECYFTSGQNHNVDDNASSCKKTKLCNFKDSNEVGVVRDSQSKGEVCVVMVSS